MHFMTEYPAAKKAVPLTATIVAVGISDVRISDSFTENDEGVLVENEYCRLAEINIRLSIHAPFSQGGEACYDAFTDIIDCLTFGSDLEITSSGCNGITADRDTDAFVLSAWINVNANLCPAQSSSVVFGSFMDKQLLCGSHINDSSLHLSEEQNEFIAAPFECGAFFGTGAASRTISLGFKPKAVFVCGNGYPLMRVNYPNQETSAYAAFGTRNGSTMGLELTDNGFRLLRGAEYQVFGNLINLNQAGTDYFFIAFK